MADPTPGMTHEDSIGSQDPHLQPKEKSKSRRPASMEAPGDLRKQKEMELTVGSFLQILRSASSD
jgi:hypothetical protein